MNTGQTRGGFTGARGSLSRGSSGGRMSASGVMVVSGWGRAPYCKLRPRRGQRAGLILFLLPGEHHLLNLAFQRRDGHERVTFVDRHAATKAGLENWLLDKAENDELADVVVLEEV